MRLKDGDIIRIFNGQDGEFTGLLSQTSKKSVSLISLTKIYEQPIEVRKIHLYFAPIKKDRLPYLIEKSVELGVTDLHPIITERTENRHLNLEKLDRYIIEASEQCERMNVPKLHPSITLMKSNFITPTYAAVEREDGLPLFQPKDNSDLGIIIGPEGGWTQLEKTILQTHPSIIPTSLGSRILRAETAAVFMISRIAQ
jgi:16S rRNA (uracil1498-N3)-methyltransferase